MQPLVLAVAVAAVAILAASPATAIDNGLGVTPP